jgi:hypothetical protein
MGKAITVLLELLSKVLTAKLGGAKGDAKEAGTSNTFRGSVADGALEERQSLL